MKTLFITAAICATALAAAAQKPYSAPRTPWGHLDLQGTWTTDDARSVPLQRAAEFGERRVLTDQEPPPPLARPNDGEILPADPSFGRRK